MQTIAKITPADYPDLLAAVEDGVSQRELALRYDCAPSLVARHVAKARRARELSDHEESDRGLTVDARPGSMREILKARIRDPRTSPRDLAALVNSLAKLDKEQKTANRPSILDHRIGTLIIEPEQRGSGTWRLMLCIPGGVNHVVDGVQPGQAFARRLLPDAGGGPGSARPRCLTAKRRVKLSRADRRQRALTRTPKLLPPKRQRG